MKQKLLVIFLCAIGAVALADQAAESKAVALIRGPYLQMGTSNSIIVCWRTDENSDSQVRFGTSVDNLVEVVSVSTATSEHFVEIGGLAPATRYFYTVGSTSESFTSADSSYSFVTSPLVGSRDPVRIWVIGDSGTASNPENKPPNPPSDPGLGARQVRDAYYAYSASRDTDLWLMLGDNAYPDGTDEEYQLAVFDMYHDMLAKSVVWSTFGNHDSYSAASATQSGAYYDIFALPTQAEAGGIASGTEAYYSFDYANIHFLCLDSQDSPRDPGSAMLNWLEQDLAATNQDWIIAFWHHPPYSKGSHDSDNPNENDGRLREMRENVLPILDNYGVDMVLCGHSHSYERSFLVHGHYDSSATLTNEMIIDGGDGRPNGDGAYLKSSGPGGEQGTIYAVNGSSARYSDGTFDHPVMVHASLQVLGSMILDVYDLQLDARFLDNTGVVADSFRILKSPALDIDSNAIAADDFKLLPNFPNPFNPSTVIRFSVPQGPSSKLRLVIYDVLGKEVVTLVDGYFSPGKHQVNWNGKDAGGRPVSSGVYLYELQIRQPQTSVSRKVRMMELLR